MSWFTKALSYLHPQTGAAKLISDIVHKIDEKRPAEPIFEPVGNPPDRVFSRTAAANADANPVYVLPTGDAVPMFGFQSPQDAAKWAAAEVAGHAYDIMNRDIANRRGGDGNGGGTPCY